MTPYRLAILNLKRHLTTTFIAVLAISLSVGVSGSLLRLFALSNSRFATLASGGEAIVGGKSGDIDILLGALNIEGPYPPFIPYNLFASLQNQEDVKFEDGVIVQNHFVELAVPLLIVGKFKEARVMGTSKGFIQRPLRENPLSLAQGTWCDQLSQAVVGAAVAKNHGLKLGSKIPVVLWTGAGRGEPDKQFMFSVSGILTETKNAWDRGIYIGLEQAQSLLPLSHEKNDNIWGTRAINYILVYLKGDSFPSLENLINRRTVAQAISVPATLDRLHDLTGSGEMLGFLISVFVIFLGGLAVAGILVTRFENMKVQLAVLRALGYQKKMLSQWLFWEGLILSGSSIVIGALFDLICFPILRELLQTSLTGPVGISIPLYTSAPVWAAAVVATTLAAFTPLWTLYRESPHRSLHI